MGTAIFERLCEKRGIDKEFLQPKYEALADPMILTGMKEVVERIGVAADRGEKVLIYGDYDVDGVTAATVMHDALKLAGVKEVGVMLPDRFKDGYGMSMRVVERAQAEGVSLVVTVDCGSRNFEVIEALAAAGVDVVVTDHHECEEEVPKAVAVVNPKRRGVAEVGALRDLAGVGVAFEVARALVKTGRIPNGQEKWMLDLVLIGTLCDSMKISRENRILTFYGAKVLKKTRRRGLLELMRMAEVARINAYAVNFKIGPRLNAAGRMADAGKALKLLMTKDPVEAAQLARDLEELNTERREMQQKAVEEVRRSGIGEEPVIVVEGEWHEGVLGIIAGKLVDEYHRPAFVMAKADVDGDGIVDVVYKGSGRSFGDFSLAEALSECRDCLISGGGHAEACGVKVAAERMADFRKRVNDYYRSLRLDGQERFLERAADIEVGAEEVGALNMELADEVASLEPYGVGNEEPLVKISGARITEVRRMGVEKRHLAVKLGSGAEALRGVAFGAKKEWLEVEPGARADVVVRLGVNEFRGRRSAEGVVESIEILD